MKFFFESHKVDELNNKEYVIIGKGRFTENLLQLIKEKGVTKPVDILESYEIGSINSLPKNLVIGSSTFQCEIIERWLPKIKKEQVFIGVEDDVISKIYGIEESNKSETNLSSKNVLFCSVEPTLNEYKWIKPLRNKIEEKGFKWERVHPLVEIDSDLLKNTKAAIVWNGEKRIHANFRSLCKRNKIPLTFAECGFFPQEKHFYLDKNGTNLNSQIRTDPLNWIDATHIDKLKTQRDKLFNGITGKDKGYIFVPLQIESDSNIQNNSRFINGMQEYIDYVVSQHPNEKIIFKPHPKDTQHHKYDYHKSLVSHENTLDLIASSKFVRGINSSVIFESALFGKKVVIDGECLLNNNKSNIKNVLAAIVHRQYESADFNFDSDKINRFSNLSFIFN